MSPGVFVLLIQLPPSSTLFPYTTLFRSVEVAVSAAGIFLVCDDDAGRPTVGGFLGAVEDQLGHLVTVDGQGQRLEELGVVVNFCVRGGGGGEGDARILGEVEVLDASLGE